MEINISSTYATVEIHDDIADKFSRTKRLFCGHARDSQHATILSLLKLPSTIQVQPQ